MNDSFDQFYGQPNDPFYYGLKPSKGLKAFLDVINLFQGEKS